MVVSRKKITIIPGKLEVLPPERRQKIKIGLGPWPQPEPEPDPPHRECGVCQSFESHWSFPTQGHPEVCLLCTTTRFVTGPGISWTDNTILNQAKGVLRAFEAEIKHAKR